MGADASTTRLLSRRDVAAVLSLDECIEAVEAAFRRAGLGELPAPGVLGTHVAGGGFHVKTAVMDGAPSYFAAKLNANFPGNPDRLGLPTIQGVIALCDASCGRLLALMDSIEITMQRTGAATAVAARYLARPASSVATIWGCGSQGRIQLAALRKVLPIGRVWLYDREPDRARALAAELSAEAFDARVADDPRIAARESDVIVTCTPATRPLLDVEAVRPGTFIAGVGADNPDKSEIAPALMAASTVVVDVLDQAATIGDLHHAIAAGALSRGQVHAELGELAARRKPGRTRDDEITIFDSTGTALQDVAAAALVYEKAVRMGVGRTIDLGKA